MTLNQFITTLNAWGENRVPFFFFVDFELKKPKVFRLDEVNPSEILFFMNGFTNAPEYSGKPLTVELKKTPVSFDDYRNRFNKVSYHLGYGDTFLTNLTVKTPIEINYSLRELFTISKAKYKLWFNEQFLVFSPETFVQIRENKIYSFPMKGTIDARIPNAAEIILQDKKEQAEHVTIVDLIRNDISQVAEQVTVSRFRYLEEIKTNNKNLLQVSSEVTGTLPVGFHKSLGDILIKLLPAGSVSGAPKPKTVEVIQKAEGEERGYYTGVVGYFDGTNLDTGVMIRYIEKAGNQYFYRSGGGITTQSQVHSEYEETIDKIYVPID
ncbi:MAG: aminodeoxychorismate synthase component I [Cyclobacteriaceae bacterium]|nr:aminodeoxychorismate synthase component I [Cyclobacteriaceae bacterium]